MDKTEKEKQRRTSRDKRQNSVSEDGLETNQVSDKIEGEAKKGEVPHWKVCGFLIAVDCLRHPSGTTKLSPPLPPPPLSLSYPQRQSGASLHKSAEVRRLRHHRRPRPRDQAALAASRQSLQHHPRDQPGGFQCITLQRPPRTVRKLLRFQICPTSFS